MSLSNEDSIADATPYRCRTVISIINQGPDTFRFWETELRSRGNARPRGCSMKNLRLEFHEISDRVSSVTDMRGRTRLTPSPSLSFARMCARARARARSLALALVPVATRRSHITHQLQGQLRFFTVNGTGACGHMGDVYGLQNRSRSLTRFETAST